jgi:hypothetical protein
MDSYENMPKNTLRWRVVANTAVRDVPKAVMRERLRRRVREAFREALKQEGYDSEGNVLQSETATGTPLRPLRGTLEIHCRGRAGLDSEFAEMTKYARGCVSTVVQSCHHSNWKKGSVGAGEQWWKLDALASKNPGIGGQRKESRPVI